MPRAYSLAYLNSHRCTPPEAIRVAAATGYGFVGLRLWPNAPGAQQQHLLGQPDALRETQAALRDTGVGVFDLEIIRIDADFEVHRWDALYDVGAALQAKAILVAGDDRDEARLTQNYARLCEVMQPYGMTADLEFMPWTAVPNAQAALRVVRNAGTPANAGILVDAIHVARSATTARPAALRADLRLRGRHAVHGRADDPHGACRTAVARGRHGRSRRLVRRIADGPADQRGGHQPAAGAAARSGAMGRDLPGGQPTLHLMHRAFP